MIWSDGPPLNIPRSGHSCGRIKSSDPFQDWTIIVVGGLNGGGYLNNTEVLNKKTMRALWCCHSTLRLKPWRNKRAEVAADPGVQQMR